MIARAIIALGAAAIVGLMLVAIFNVGFGLGPQGYEPRDSLNYLWGGLTVGLWAFFYYHNKPSDSD